MKPINKSVPWIAVGVGVLGFFAVSPAGQAQDLASPQLAAMKQYCQGCHNDKAKTGAAAIPRRRPRS